MLEKTYSIDITNFCLSHNEPFLCYLNNGEIMVMEDKGNTYSFKFYNLDGFTSGFEMRSSVGKLTGAVQYNGEYFFEFESKSGTYDEKYFIYSYNGSTLRLVSEFTRQCYLKSDGYHNIFADDEGLHLYLVKHNRLHKYIYSGLSFIEEEVNIVDSWEYISNGYFVASSEGSLKIYGPHNYLFEFDGEDISIDKGIFSLSGRCFAATLTDLEYKRSVLCIYDFLTKKTSKVFIEDIVSALGIVGSRVWLNTYNEHEYTDTTASAGGCLIYSLDGSLDYKHVISKVSDTYSGAFVPPFYKASLISPTANNFAIVLEENMIKFFDSTAKLQDKILFRKGNTFICISKNGDIAILTRKDLFSGSSTEMTLDVYKYVSSTQGRIAKFGDLLSNI